MKRPGPKKYLEVAALVSKGYGICQALDELKVGRRHFYEKMDSLDRITLISLKEEYINRKNTATNKDRHKFF